MCIAGQGRQENSFRYRYSKYRARTACLISVIMIVLRNYENIIKKRVKKAYYNLFNKIIYSIINDQSIYFHCILFCCNFNKQYQLCVFVLTRGL